MENIINNINDIASKVNELTKKRDELNHEIWVKKCKVKKVLTSKPGWNLFIAGYCRYGDKEDYVNGIGNYVKNGLETPNAGNLSISFDGDKVIIEDYITWGYDEHDDWTFEIPMKKFIEFCSSDDYMQKVLDRYISIKNYIKKKEELEKETNEKKLYEELKKKYG